MTNLINKFLRYYQPVVQLTAEGRGSLANGKMRRGKLRGIPPRPDSRRRLRMYAFPEMLDMTKQEWPTDDHKIVAEKILIGNGSYATLTDLMDGAAIIAAIPADKIRKVTVADLYTLGIMLP